MKSMSNNPGAFIFKEKTIVCLPEINSYSSYALEKSSFHILDGSNLPLLSDITT